MFKKKIKYIAIGLIAGLCINNISAIASSINLIVSKVTYSVMINNKPLETDKPILNYEGSTYLPLKAIGDSLGVKVAWNNELRRVEIGNSVVSPTPSPVPTPIPMLKFDNYLSLIKVDNKLYSFGITLETLQKDTKGKYFISAGVVGVILSAGFGDYAIKNESNNPFLNGSIQINPSEYVKIDSKYISISKTTREYYFTNKDGSKKFVLEKDGVYENGYTVKNGRGIICLDDVLNYFDVKYKIEINDTDKLFIFSFPK